MKKNKDYKLDVFLPGELVDLSIPTSDFAEHSNWYSWFNDKTITKFLYQGTYPQTNIDQLEFFQNVPEDRLVLIIVDKKGYNIGVISLSFIDIIKKSCDIALVVSNEGDKLLRPYVSLEAMALMTSHAFNHLGLERINAGQHIALAGWQNRLELIGYKLEGLHKNKFIKGSEISDCMSVAIVRNDYEMICNKRKGNLWDNINEMKSRVKNFPKKTYLDKLKDIYVNERNSYYKNVFDL